MLLSAKCGTGEYAPEASFSGTNQPIWMASIVCVFGEITLNSVTWWCKCKIFVRI